MVQLDKLEKGKRAMIESVDLDIETKRRFSNMGLSPGVILRVCRRTFGSDSLHVKLECAACIALSKSEAKHIKVTPIGGKGGLGYCYRGGGYKPKDYCCEREDCQLKDETQLK
ncbi:MAG: FeoA family protein [Sulfurospirillum sp.]